MWRTRQDCTPAIFFQFWIEDLGSFCRGNIRYSINICGGPAAGLLLGYFWISSSEINQENEIPAFILPMRCNKFPVHSPQGSHSPSVLPRSYRDIKVQGQHSRTERKNMELDCVIKSSGVLQIHAEIKVSSVKTPALSNVKSGAGHSIPFYYIQCDVFSWLFRPTLRYLTVWKEANNK